MATKDPVAIAKAIRSHVCTKYLNLAELTVHTVRARNSNQNVAPSVISIIPATFSSDGSLTGIQLFLDEIPIPPNKFDFNEHDRVLTWNNAYGGGRLFLSHDGTFAHGSVGCMSEATTFEAGATAVFTCDVAEDVGAAFESFEDTNIKIDWDPSSPKWKNANWTGEKQKSRLKIKYSIEDGGSMHHDNINFDFEDLLYEVGDTYAIDGSDYIASIGMGSRDSEVGWTVKFLNASNGTDFGNGYMIPTCFQGFEDGAITEIDGSFCVDIDIKSSPKLYGAQGERGNPTVGGYYLCGENVSPFGVFQSKLKVDGRSLKEMKSYVRGNELHWRGLPPRFQEKLGLPGTGILIFSADGSIGRAPGGELSATRLSATEALTAIRATSGIYQDINSLLRTTSFASMFEDDVNYSVEELARLSPFQQDEDKNWSDIVQNAVLYDMWTIMRSFIPSSLWNGLFPDDSQPELDGYLADVANTEVKDGNKVLDPADFYESLSTEVICISLKDSADENAKRLNSVRAETRLNEKTSSSPIYKNHSQQLFVIHWNKVHKVTLDYIKDQTDNAEAYEPEINQEEKRQLGEIDKYVYQQPDSDLKQEMKKIVQSAADHARKNKLYWAFALYTYQTDPTALATYQNAISIGGNDDGTFLTRQFQSTCATLTALDSSGTFTKNFVQTLNSFLGTTLMLSLVDFTDPALTPELMASYLDSLVEACVHSGDKDLSDAGNNIRSILSADNASQVIDESMEAIQTIAEGCQGVTGNKTVSNKFTKWFTDTFDYSKPVRECFCNALEYGMAANSIWMMYLGYSDFSELSADEKANLIVNSVQTGMEGLQAMVAGAAKLADLFTASGTSVMARIASFGAFAKTGLADGLEWLADVLHRLGGRISKWLSKVVGGASKALISISAKSVQEVADRLGKNLEEVMATRIGPIFSLAGIAFSIAAIAEGDTGLSLGSDICGILGGSLEIFAAAGEWALAEIVGEEVIAVMVSVAGPLAIVLALVGIGLALAAMFTDKPNPMEDFVNNQASGEGLSLTSACNAVDYVAISYLSDSKGYELIGATLSPGSDGKSLCAKTGTNVVLGVNDYSPNYVMQITTDGEGLSTISTAVGSESDGYSIMLYLCVSEKEEDHTQIISFENAFSDDGQKFNPQKWRCSATLSPAKLDKERLSSMQISIEHVGEDGSKGNGFLQLDSNKNIVLDSTEASWTLDMEGIKPVGMSITTPMEYLAQHSICVQQKYLPSFVISPSGTMKYSCSAGLPSFLVFNEKTGAVTPTGDVVTPSGDTNLTMYAESPLGKASTKFTVSVKTGNAVRL